MRREVGTEPEAGRQGRTMSAFEKSKLPIGQHWIVITSWYDDRREYWRASAPIYAYLGLFTHCPLITCPSRQEAVEQVCDLLAIHFQRLAFRKKETLCIHRVTFR